MEKAGRFNALCFSFGLVFFMLFTVSFSSAAITYTYQENANQTGIDYSKNYALSGHNPGSLFMNYTKPENINLSGAIWQVKHGYFPAYNITLPDSCFSANPTTIILRIDSSTRLNLTEAWGDEFGNSTSQPWCYNSTDWEKIGNSAVGPAYENSFGPGIGYNFAFDGNWSTWSVKIVDRGSWAAFKNNGMLNDYGAICAESDALAANIYEEAMIWEIDNGGGKKAAEEVSVIQETTPVIISETVQSPVNHEKKSRKKNKIKTIQVSIFNPVVKEALKLIILNSKSNADNLIILN